MANVCEYEIRAKGNRNAIRLVFESMPVYDNKSIISETGNGNECELIFKGDCKWSVNYGVQDEWDRERLDVDSLTGGETEGLGAELWNYSLRVKSEVFGCEILVHYWSGESGFDQFDHYIKGKLIKQRKIAYSYEKKNEFDWSTREFKGHEGEYDESVQGEADDVDFMKKLGAIFGSIDADADIPVSEDSGDTGSDVRLSADRVYSWSFSCGQRVSDGGFSIAVPDGYVKSNYNNRAFELVPKGSDETAAVMIMASQKNAISVDDSLIKHHLNTMKGVAALYGAKITGLTQKSPFGAIIKPEDMFVFANNGWCAYATIQNTGLGSVSIQIQVMTDKDAQMLRIQTQYIDSSQKKALMNSLKRWLDTLSFEDGGYKPDTEEPFKNAEKIVKELSEGSVGSFEENAEEVYNDIKICHSGLIEMIKILGECGVDNRKLEKKVVYTLNAALEVSEYYRIKADKILTDAKAAGADDKTLAKAYKIINIEVPPSLNLNGKKIEVKNPPKLAEIHKRWSAEMKKLGVFADGKTDPETKSVNNKHEDIEDDLYKVMLTDGGMFTVEKLSDLPQFSDYTIQFMMAKLRKMTLDGRLKRERIAHSVFFSAIPPKTEEDIKREKEEAKRKAEEAKRKAEEAKRKAEEAKRKAEEAKRKAEAKREEEAKRKEEENKRAEAAKKKYETIVKELENREKELDNMLSGATAKKAEEVKRELSKKQQELQGEYESAKKAYESLGFFKFKDKSIAKNSMRNAEKKLKSFNINNEMTRRIESINLTADKIRKAYKKEIELYLDYRFPNRNITTKIKLSEIDEIKKNIFDILRSNNSGMTVMEITETLGGEHTPQKISAIMRQMVLDGYAERETNRNCVVFRVASDMKANPYIKEDKDAFFEKYSENEKMKDKPHPDLPEIVL